MYMCYYAMALERQGKLQNVKLANDLYKEVLNLDANHSLALINYAVFLHR
jgi:hypothetical protein